MAEEGELDRPNDSRPPRPTARVRQLELLLRQLEFLPALPEVLTGLGVAPAGARELRDRLAAAADRDALLARVLFQLARRRHPRSRAGTAAEAVEALGAENARRDLLSAKVVQAFGASGGALDRRGFWAHCLAVAEAAEAAARRLKGTVGPAEAFAAGLLHDVGKVALDACLPKSYRRVLEAVAGQAGNIADAEEEIIGVDHALLGRRLARRWRLGREIEQAIWLHHHSPEATGDELPAAALIAVVQLADTLAREQRIGFSGNHIFPAGSAELGRAAGLSVKDVAAIAAEVGEQVDRQGELVSLALSGVRAPAAAAAAPRPERPSPVQPPAGSPRQRLLGALGEFIGRIDAATALPQLCWEMARAYRTAFAAPPAGAPTCAFCFSDDGGSAFLSVYEGERPGRFRLASCRSAAPAPLRRTAPAGRLLRPVLDPPDAWADLLDLDEYVCLPLLFEGQWLGGILTTSPAAGPRELEQLLCDWLGFALAAAAGRHTADRLAEQLARAAERLAASRDTLAQSKALEAVAEMAAGAAHELNNPLAVISGRAQIIARGTRSAKQRQAAELIVSKAEEVSRIASELMEFARPDPPKPSAVDVAELLESVSNRPPGAAQSKAKPARVDIQVEPGCPAVRVDAAQIRQVLAELVGNAAGAGGKRVNVRLVAGARGGSEHVLIRVVDDGPGMDEETLAMAFTPFFSHRPAGRGRGLGLARAKRTVQANGGRIWIDSRPKKGTTVFLELPQAEAPAS